MKSSERARRKHGLQAPTHGEVLNPFGQVVGTFLFIWNDGEDGPDPAELAHVFPAGFRVPLDRGDITRWSLRAL